MMFGWLKDKRQLQAALAEVRRERAAELEEAREECADLAHSLEVVSKSFNEAQAALAEARRERDVGRRKVGHLLMALEQRGDRAVAVPPPARTPSQELQQERARADALGARVQQLQEANLRADCMHGIPVQGPVSAPPGSFRF